MSTPGHDVRKRKASAAPMTPWMEQARCPKVAKAAQDEVCDSDCTSAVSPVLPPQLSEDGETSGLYSTRLSTCSSLGWSADEAIDAAEPTRYIRGTRLVTWGWLQMCRGCNEITGKEKRIGGRDISLCPKCQDKHTRMVAGEYPPNCPPGAFQHEPLCFWVPRLLPLMPRLTPQQREAYCNELILRQDDAWQALIAQS